MKVQNTLKRIIASVLMLALVFSFGATSVFAADTAGIEPIAPAAKKSGNNQITFSNLGAMKVGDIVEYEVTDSNGDPAVISIERVALPLSLNESNSRAADPRAWKVSYTGAVINCYFYMTVSNNKVTSVYDSWILTIGYTYSDTSLVKTTTYGKLSFVATIYGGFASLSCWLKGTVTGSENDITVTYSM